MTWRWASNKLFQTCLEVKYGYEVDLTGRNDD